MASPVIRVSPDECLMRVKRPDGTTKLVKFPAEHLQRVMDLCAGEFGDKSIDLGGPELPPPEQGGHKI